MDIFFLALSGVALVFAGAFNLGQLHGEKVMRDKVVLYCVEKPEICKKEYENIKTQNKLNDYKRPELE